MRLGNHEDAAGDDVREADAGGADLHDAGLAFLAQPELALGGDAERLEHLARARIESGFDDPGDGADGQIGERNGERRHCRAWYHENEMSLI